MNEKEKDEEQRFREVYRNVTLAQCQQEKEVAVSLVVVSLSLGKEEELFRFLFENDIYNKSGPVYRDENLSLVCLRALLEVLGGREEMLSLLRTCLSVSSQLFVPEHNPPELESKLVLKEVENILITFLEKNKEERQSFWGIFGRILGILMSVLESTDKIAPQTPVELLSSIFFLRFGLLMLLL